MGQETALKIIMTVAYRMLTGENTKGKEFLFQRQSKEESYKENMKEKEIK